MSLEWPYHWVLGILVFGAAAWFVAAKWPARAWLAGALNVAAAVIGAQIIEPLGEVVFYGVPLDRMLDAAQWTAFAQFMAAGLLTYLLVMPLALARSGNA